MREFHMTEEQALNYPLSRAFALKSYDIENNAWSKPVYKTKGYIGQEMERLKILTADGR